MGATRRGQPRRMGQARVKPLLRNDFRSAGLSDVHSEPPQGCLEWRRGLPPRAATYRGHRRCTYGAANRGRDSDRVGDRTAVSSDAVDPTRGDDDPLRWLDRSQARPTGSSGRWCRNDADPKGAVSHGSKGLVASVRGRNLRANWAERSRTARPSNGSSTSRPAEANEARSSVRLEGPRRGTKPREDRVAPCRQRYVASTDLSTEQRLGVEGGDGRDRKW